MNKKLEEILEGVDCCCYNRRAGKTEIHESYCYITKTKQAFAAGQEAKGVVQLEQIGMKVAEALPPYQTGYNDGIKKGRQEVFDFLKSRWRIISLEKEMKEKFGVK